MVKWLVYIKEWLLESNRVFFSNRFRKNCVSVNVRSNKPGFRVTQEDAFRVTRLKPDFKKGWFLLAKALWKDSAWGLLGVLDLHGGKWKVLELEALPSGYVNSLLLKMASK